MNVISPVLSAATDAIATAVWLIGQLNEKENAHPAIVGGLFERLRTQLRALPLDLSEHCYFLNTADGCEAMAGGGDHLSALWQMTQLVRRLRGYRDRWESGPTPAPQPAVPAAAQHEAMPLAGPGDAAAAPGA